MTESQSDWLKAVDINGEKGRKQSVCLKAGEIDGERWEQEWLTDSR